MQRTTERLLRRVPMVLAVALMLNGCAAFRALPPAGHSPSASAASGPSSTASAAATASPAATSSTTAPPAPPADAAKESAVRRALAKLAAIVDGDPHHAGAMYIAAKLAASIGDDTVASSWLDRLEQARFGDQLEAADFGAFADTPAFRGRAERFAQAAPPAGSARMWTQTRCAGIAPEGTAWDARRRELLLSSLKQRTIVAVRSTGECRPLVAAGERRLLAVLGLSVDDATDTVWAATAATPEMGDAMAGEEGTSRLVAVSLASGKVVREHALGDGALLNDLARATDGTIYVTETNGGTVYRLSAGGASLERIVAGKTFEGPNGIAVTPGGDLLVADFHGLSLIRRPSSPTPSVERLQSPDRLYLGGIDGLARAGDRFVAIQNLVGRGRVWLLTLEADGGRIARADLLLRAHPDVRMPTTGAVSGNRFLFVADPQWQQEATTEGAAPALSNARAGYLVLELPLDAG